MGETNPATGGLILAKKKTHDGGGGVSTANMTEPGARVSYRQADIDRLETQLRGLSPQHPLIYSPPTSTLSPIPSSYVNMATAKDMNTLNTRNTFTAFGFKRDSSAYFRDLLRTQPQMFDQYNVAEVNAGRAPIVNAQWLKYNPSHSAFINQKLIHHHWMQGNIAVAIPEPVHHRWNSTLHPYR